MALGEAPAAVVPNEHPRHAEARIDRLHTDRRVDGEEPGVNDTRGDRYFEMTGRK